MLAWMARLHPEKIAGDQGQHHHLPLQTNRLRYLLVESEVLLQHAESEDRS